MKMCVLKVRIKPIVGASGKVEMLNSNSNCEGGLRYYA